jgi:Ca2+-dependent lipid-binding protein
MKTLDPHYHETMLLALPFEATRISIDFTCYDWDMMKKDDVCGYGQITVSLDSLTEPVEHQESLTPEGGTVFFRLEIGTEKK